MKPPIEMSSAAHEAGQTALAAAIDLMSEVRRDRARIGTRLPIVHETLDAFCSAALAGAPIACKAGCSNCCSQWVPGVKVFEIEAIAAVVEASGDRDAIVRGLRARAEAYDAITDPDRDIAYSRLGLPCVFLTADGTCGIRSIRPSTCRTFFSFGPPEHCAGHPAATGFVVEPDPSYEAVLARAEQPFDAERRYTGELIRDLLARMV